MLQSATEKRQRRSRRARVIALIGTRAWDLKVDGSDLGVRKRRGQEEREAGGNAIRPAFATEEQRRPRRAYWSRERHRRHDQSA
ncbi:hypothetical protein OPV22_025046 [Ensete ventricosum]|uniref:Uncharacterized protein n=1 Tax=Ensete ventricosum TaxID=4639 RepID=A0AAV8QCR4_ENSVE|nr:hypothetical protein OPV22_025046 [Ensete ventricosum]